MKCSLLIGILLANIFAYSQDKTGTLTNADLNIVSRLSTDLKENINLLQDTNGIALTKYLKAELVDEATYYAKMQTAISPIVYDNQRFKKTNGVTTLKCRDTVVTFTDIDSDGEDFKEHYYDSYLPALNQYIVKATYYEEYDYIYVDMNSGRQTSFNGSIPYLAPNKKMLLDVYHEPYENTVSFSLIKVGKKEFTTLISTEFKYWMPATDTASAPFWGKDGYFYCIAIAVEDKDKPDAAHQYVRIKLL
ncbi:hypothetical protein FMM05_10755 [Flavobacterium zepuense]|uniref:Uncharacterized protein n=1 Tax=Flavobacterium zepuense TaxID=2593302 RepID=A0A552V1G8_9FLAO|nr:hypothetical protein [Flavobacterium zepuense]TRW24304.1 hypothetical protein FMM05_10755 [Flavobacterium zepuense]